MYQRFGSRVAGSAACLGAFRKCRFFRANEIVELNGQRLMKTPDSLALSWKAGSLAKCNFLVFLRNW